MNRRKIGTEQEKIAGAYLESRGYRILEYNFRAPRSEIDIVARDGRYLVFVEVKYRVSGHSGHPLEAVDLRKQRRICLAARYYLYTHGQGEDTPCRFDVIGIEGDGVMLVKDAFPLC